MIEIKQLQVTRGGKTICAVEHLMAKSGERLVVVGPNGSGKSTLLRVIAGLIVDYSGQCEVSAGSRERTYVHQQPILFRGSVLSNVRYGQQGRAGGSAVFQSCVPTTSSLCCVSMYSLYYVRM